MSSHNVTPSEPRGRDASPSGGFSLPRISTCTPRPSSFHARRTSAKFFLSSMAAKLSIRHDSASSSSRSPPRAPPFEGGESQLPPPFEGGERGGSGIALT